MTVFILDDHGDITGVYSTREMARDAVTAQFAHWGSVPTAPSWYEGDPRDWRITECIVDDHSNDYTHELKTTPETK
jgi:hypothetical protein